jgi:hypothetical protein
MLFLALNKVYAFDPVVESMTPQKLNMFLVVKLIYGVYNSEALRVYAFPKTGGVVLCLWSTKESALGRFS